VRERERGAGGRVVDGRKREDGRKLEVKAEVRENENRLAKGRPMEGEDGGAREKERLKGRVMKGRQGRRYDTWMGYERKSGSGGR